MDQIEIVPLEDGTWNWHKRLGGTVVETGEGYETRGPAIEAAKLANGHEQANVVLEGGKVVGSVQIDGSLRIVLLRLDGSEYGELAPAASEGSATQLVSIAPASEGDGSGDADVVVEVAQEEVRHDG